MFDFLKGGKANLKLTLDHPLQPYYLGETVHAKVEIEGEKDLKVQQGRVVLVCREEYEYRYQTQSTDSDGRTTTDENRSWQTDEKEVNRQVFFGETTIRAGSKQAFEYDLPIPPNLPPTCEGGRIVRVKWLVKATLDRRLASDIEQVAEIYVFAYPPGTMVGAREYGYSTEPGEAELALSLPGKEYVLGETISGEFLVRPKKEFDATEVRIELTRREFVPRDLGNEHLEVKAIKVAGPTKLQPGQNLTFPFSLTLPSPSPVTCRTNNSSVNWLVKGILARRLRSDTRVEEEMFVYSGRPQ
jgi:sporulation-control protein spo0M